MADLSIRDLTVEYSSGGYAVRPIDGLNHEVKSGSLGLLLGPSGCGKSTLLSCLAGILTPTSGEIWLGDDRISGLEGKELTDYRRWKVGIVFQAFNLVPSLTALENVMAPMRAAGIGGREAKARAAELIERVNLTQRAKHHPGDMSGGQQQRVAIARALACDPPLLLADEPTAHLDYVQVESVLELLRELAEPGRIVVVATHDERMLPLADHVLEMAPKFADPAGGPERVELAAGETLFEQGSRGNRIYEVEVGSIGIYRALAGGGEEQLAVIPTGGHFGEMGPLFSLPRSATARAVEASVVVGYTVRQFGERMGATYLKELVDDGPT
ncbi:MAG TPA: ATP-binding cassette domain-containing protein [Acidimicrobiia bacterium]|nr:ATP-binding cassette domain-containing protein [Acidimicrobiia bacterium]